MPIITESITKLRTSSTYLKSMYVNISIYPPYTDLFWNSKQVILIIFLLIRGRPEQNFGAPKLKCSGFHSILNK